MASVTLTQVWIHDASDLSSSITLNALSIVERPVTGAQSRRYAGGNYRLIAVSGTQRLIDFVFDFVDRDDLTTLVGWEQSLVMVRDPVGRKLWGMFPTLTIEERELSDTTLVYRVSAPFQQITADETV